jgi:hypothetical protein
MGTRPLNQEKRSTDCQHHRTEQHQPFMSPPCNCI